MNRRPRAADDVDLGTRQRGGWRTLLAPPQTRLGYALDVVILVGVTFFGPWLIGWLFLHVHPQTPMIRLIFALLAHAPAVLVVVALVTKWKWWKRVGWQVPDWRATHR